MDTTLEMQIKTTGEETLKVIKELNTSITGLVTTLNKISGSTSGIENLGKVSEKTLGKVDKLSTSFNKLFTAMAFKKIGNKALDFLDNASNRAEELNLFNVIFKNIKKNGEQTFSDLGLDAIRFQNKLNEAFGTNMTETLRYQGLFQAMATNQGIGEKYAGIMSENMVKLTYDLASLYNRSEKTVAEALRGGVYAGQTKPLRGFGIDVTQTSMKPVLDSLGITDRSINQMSQAEKQILRYIATLNQAKAAMGDFAETIESPANQIKIFKQQLVEAKTALGNLFIGVYSEILPYANAILMVIKEIAKAIADIFGLDTGDYNSGLASTEEIYDGIATSAGNAAKAAKELKRQLLKFDEVNNITTPSTSGGGSGSGLGTNGIDQRLLDAIKGYDNLMSKVRMKATEIRDRWMEILGFKKVINPLTGEVNFKYQGFATTVKNLVKWFDELGIKTKIFIGLGLATTFAKIVNSVKRLNTSLGNTGLIKIVKSFLSPTTSLIQNIGGLSLAYGNLSDGFKVGITNWRTQMGLIDTSNTKLSTMTKTINGVKVGVISLAEGIIGLQLLSESMKSVAENGFNLGNALQMAGGAITTIVSGVQLGAIFGPVGAVIGGVSAAIISLTTALGVYEDSLGNSYKTINDYSESLIEQHKKVQDELSEALAVPEAHQALLDELSQIVDKNGKIKKGYEERAQFIVTTLSQAYGVEIKIEDGLIVKYDKKIDKIKEAIKQKKVEIALQKADEDYTVALQSRQETYNNLLAAQKKYNEAWEQYNKAPINLKSAYYENLRVAKETLTGAQKAYDSNTKAIMNYQGLLTASTEDNTEKINYYIEEIEKQYAKTRGQVYMTLSEQVKDAEEYYKSVIRVTGESEEEMTDKVKSEAESKYNAVIGLLQNEMNYIKGITDEYAEGWYTLSQTSSSKFLDSFKELPKDIQQQVVDKMQDKGYAISDELQKGIKKLNPEINFKFKADTTSLTSSVTKVADTAKNTVLKVLGLTKANGGIFNGTSWSNIPQYANGGMPSHGTLFTAGENGAEIVGNINRRTEVLNRSQIASSIYSAVVAAMSQFNGGSSQIDVHVHTDEGTVVDRINQKTKQTGRCPINIPSY